MAQLLNKLAGLSLASRFIFLKYLHLRQVTIQLNMTDTVTLSIITHSMMTFSTMTIRTIKIRTTTMTISTMTYGTTTVSISKKTAWVLQFIYNVVCC